MYEVIEPQLALNTVNPADPLLAMAGFAIDRSPEDTLSAFPTHASDADLLLEPAPDPMYMPPKDGDDSGDTTSADIVVIGHWSDPLAESFLASMWMLETMSWEPISLYYEYNPIDPYAGTATPESIDNSKLDPTGTFDLTNTREIHKTVGGHTIVLVIDNKTVPTDSLDIVKVMAAIDNLTTNFSSLTLEAKAALAALDHIVITQSPERSYAESRTNSFFLDYDQLIHPNSTVSFLSSIIIHDAGHNLLYDVNQDWAYHSGDAGEAFCYDLQYDNRGATALAPHEIAHLETFINDPSLDDAQTNLSPYPN